MKNVVIMSLLLSFAVVVSAPQPALAEPYTEPNNAAAAIVIGGVLVIGAIWLLVSYSRDQEHTAKDKALSVKDEYVSEIRSVSTADGKVTLLHW